MSRVFISTFDDPFVNLALEACLWGLWENGQRHLLLWQNRPCIVIGRFQNPWLECRMDILKQQDIPLVRRTSGGGAVYHDPGNLCFSFFNADWNRSKEVNLDFIIATLKTFGVRLRRNKRHDLLHPGSDDSPRKISGSAFRQKKDRALHHGTLLINSDLRALKTYLSPRPEAIASKALPSTPSPVANLSDINKSLTVARVRDELARNFSDHVTHINEGFIQQHESLYRKEYKKISDWKWRHGETPDFTQVLTRNHPGGTIKLKLEVSKGVIERVLPAEPSPVPITDTRQWEQSWVGRNYAEIALS